VAASLPAPTPASSRRPGWASCRCPGALGWRVSRSRGRRRGLAASARAVAIPGARSRRRLRAGPL